MRCQCRNVPNESRDEPEAVGRDAFYYFLNHLLGWIYQLALAIRRMKAKYMVAIRVLDASHNMWFQFPNEAGLLIWKDRLYRLANV